MAQHIGARGKEFVLLSLHVSYTAYLKDELQAQGSFQDPQ